MTTIDVEKKQAGLDRALEDLRTGDVYHAKDTSDLFRQILG